MRRRLPCIQGLMMYATVKYSGGHIRKTCFEAGMVLFLLESAVQVGADVFGILEAHAEADQPLDDARGVALGRGYPSVRGGCGMADGGLHVAEVGGVGDELGRVDHAPG